MDEKINQFNEIHKSDKTESGFEDAPTINLCRHPEHLPPTHLYIPHGKIYRHVCPGCKNTIRLNGSEISFGL